MKLDRGQPPLFMAYWLWAAVYLFAVVANGVATACRHTFTGCRHKVATTLITMA